MVKLTKSQLPDGTEIKCEGDYRTGPVFDTLEKDCHGKCYICEDKPTSVEVEHIVPHGNVPGLKYSWENMLLACRHCNSIKGTGYSGIINPVLCDPEEYIALSLEIGDDLVERVRIELIEEGCAASETADLLNYVYNEGLTAQKRLECTNLRNKCSNEIHGFRWLIDAYRKLLKGEPGQGGSAHSEKPETYREEIEKELARSSMFAAFKRKIVRDRPDLAEDFSEALK